MGGLGFMYARASGCILLYEVMQENFFHILHYYVDAACSRSLLPICNQGLAAG